MTQQRKIWFISGVSSGLGRAFADQIASTGDIVVGSVRKAEDATAFEAALGSNARAVLMDVTNADQIAAAVDKVESEFGRIDILINNAGFGLIGALEELSADELQSIFDTNVFGAAVLTKAVLPLMRKRRSGHVIFTSSIAGMAGAPGLTAYSSTKHAIEGMAESLHYELKPLGINVSILEPGVFRTNWGGGNMRKAKAPIADYDASRGALEGHFAKTYAEGAATQGDPKKAAKALVRLVNADTPPLRLVLGSDAIREIEKKLARFKSEREEWHEVSTSVAFDQEAAFEEFGVTEH
ncbi:MAG: oxidoreductase [Pseudomonadota bacterium]